MASAESNEWLTTVAYLSRSVDAPPAHRYADVNVISDRWIYGLLAICAVSWIVIGLVGYGLAVGVVKLLIWIGA